MKHGIAFAIVLLCLNASIFCKADLRGESSLPESITSGEKGKLTPTKLTERIGKNQRISQRILQPKTTVKIEVIQNQPGLLLPTPAFVFSEIVEGVIDSPADLTPKVFALNWDSTNSEKEIAVSSIKFANTRAWTEIKLDKDIPSISNKTLKIVFLNYPTQDILSSQNLYIYNESSTRFSWTLGMVIGYICVVLSGMCMLCGIKQFYHVIRITQVLSLMAFLTCFKPNSFLNVVQGLLTNLFNIVPFFAVNEPDTVACQPNIAFYSQGWSCLAYNTLRSYFIEFAAFLLILGFVITNKYQETAFWFALKQALTFKNYLLAILPHLLLAALANSVVVLSNNSLALGFLFSLVVVVAYWAVLRDLVSFYFDSHEHERLLQILQPYCFSRTALDVTNPRLGRFVLAVVLDKLKLVVFCIMLGLFGRDSSIQLYVSVAIFLLNGLFILLVRPYTERVQTVVLGLSDLLIAAILIILAVVNSKTDSVAPDKLHADYGGILIVIVYVVLALNLVIFLSLVLKGSDGSDVIPSNQVLPEPGTEMQHSHNLSSGVMDETRNDPENRSLAVTSMAQHAKANTLVVKEPKANLTMQAISTSTKPSVSNKLSRMDSDEHPASVTKSVDSPIVPNKVKSRDDEAEFVLSTNGDNLRQRSGLADMKSVDSNLAVPKPSPRVRVQLLEAENQSPVAAVKPADWD